MISRDEVWGVLEGYDTKKVKVGVLASHSALDVADGAAEEGFPSVLFCQKGREATYARYFKSQYKAGRVARGMVDEARVYPKFKDMLAKKEQEKMRAESLIFVPNRSFTSYCSMDEIEDEFKVPMIGSRNMLRVEERGRGKDYYWLLEKAGLPFPEKIAKPEDIDELAIVKLHHAQKKLERGFFTAATPEQYKAKSQALIKQGVITKADLGNARIERYVVGPVFNLDFFYSPIEDEMEPLELIGVDWRFESSLDGHVRLPAPQQMDLVGTPQEIPEMTVCGHNSATIRESLLDKAFVLGETFVKAAKKHYDPGIIGAFCLQTCIDKDLNYYIYDVAPRIGGGTNVHVAVGHPYGNALWRTPMSTGRRTVLEIKRAIEQDRLKEIVT
ncbi:MAG: formate--phosphoribosylaminoimidazolecarboxamide ligase family protein [Candidatus Altiarchaeota archaeon]